MGSGFDKLIYRKRKHKVSVPQSVTKTVYKQGRPSLVLMRSFLNSYYSHSEFTADKWSVISYTGIKAEAIK